MHEILSMLGQLLPQPGGLCWNIFIWKMIQTKNNPNNPVDPVQFSQLKRTHISKRNGFCFMKSFIRQDLQDLLDIHFLTFQRKAKKF